MQVTTLKIDKAKHHLIKLIAAAKGMGINDVTNEALDRYIDTELPHIKFPKVRPETVQVK